MNTPKISVCIPAYNASKYIQDTLHSVKDQIYQNWELIIVEDGITDGTDEIVYEFKKKVEQRIVYYSHEKNLGVSAARNSAVSFATGEWIAFLDSDDLWEVNHLKDLMATALKYPESTLIQSEVIVFDSTRNVKLPSELLSQQVISQLPLSLFDGRYPTQPSTVMIASHVFRAINGFDVKSEIQGCEDKELWFRIAKAGHKFAFTGNATSLYRKHSEALSANSGRMAVAMAEVYSLHYGWNEIPQHIRSATISSAWLSAARIIRSSNKKLAKEYLSKSMMYRVTFEHLLLWIKFRILG